MQKETALLRQPLLLYRSDSLRIVLAQFFVDVLQI